MARLILLAEALDARLMGDEGETYRDADKPHVSTPPYDPRDNEANVWREPPPGYTEAYERQRQTTLAAQDARLEQDKSERSRQLADEVERIKKRGRIVRNVVAFVILLAVVLKGLRLLAGDSG